MIVRLPIILINVNNTRSGCLLMDNNFENLTAAHSEVIFHGICEKALYDWCFSIQAYVTEKIIFCFFLIRLFVV